MIIKEPLSYPGKYESYQIKINCSECGTEVIKTSPTQKYCPMCSKAVQKRQQKKWKEENREKVKENNRKYAQKYYRMHKEAVLNNNKAYREKNKKYFQDYKHQYYLEHRDYFSHYYCSKNHNNCEDCPYNDCIKA